MSNPLRPARLAAGILISAVAAATAPAPAAAQGTGDLERLGRAEFERGYRMGREDERRRRLRTTEAERRGEERNFYATHGFDDPWFSYGYEFGERDRGGFTGRGLARRGSEVDMFGLFE
jgi:hypothetical protein